MSMFERLIYLLLWLGLLGFALLLAPTPNASLGAEVLAMLMFDSARVDPIAIAIFNLLGVLPAAFAALLLADAGRPRPGPFVLGTFALGAFALLPYLIVREDDASLSRRPGRIARILGSRTAGVLLTLIAIALLLLAATGSPAAYWAQAQQSTLIAVMSMDFVILTLVLHRTATLDRRRAAGARAEAGQTRLGRVLWLPLLGPLLYLVLRRGMPDH